MSNTENKAFSTEEKKEEKFTVTNFPRHMRDAIENIVENDGRWSSVSGFVRSHLRDAINSFPEDMRKKQD